MRRAVQATVVSAELRYSTESTKRRSQKLAISATQQTRERLVFESVKLASPFRAQTMQTLIGLLAVTGLRVGEAIRLNRTDIDFETGIITVRDSKGHKSRHLPISPSTSNALLSYLTDWGCYFPDAIAALTTTTGTRLSSNNLGTTFAEVVSLAGLKTGPQGAAPRLRGLRHSFAVAALVNFYNSGRDVAAMLPVLSAYMGHVSPASTYWYYSDPRVIPIPLSLHA
jgi:integrase/recombinase XerD